MLAKVLAVIAIVMGLVGVSTGAFGPPYGVATVTRSLMGIAGIVGGVLVFRGRPGWFPVLMTWSVLQIPVLIVDPSGALTSQGCHLGFVETQQTEVNGVVTSMSGFGLNAAGILLVVLTFAARRASASPDDAS